MGCALAFFLHPKPRDTRPRAAAPPLHCHWAPGLPPAVHMGCGTRVCGHRRATFAKAISTAARVAPHASYPPPTTRHPTASLSHDQCISRASVPTHPIATLTHARHHHHHAAAPARPAPLSNRADRPAALSRGPTRYLWLKHIAKMPTWKRPSNSAGGSCYDSAPLTYRQHMHSRHGTGDREKGEGRGRDRDRDRSVPCTFST